MNLSSPFAFMSFSSFSSARAYASYEPFIGKSKMPSKISYEPLTPHIGVRVHVESLMDITDEDKKELRSLLNEHLVLVLPDQDLTEDGQVEVTEIFGPFEYSTLTGKGQKRVVFVSNKDDGVLGNSELRWHSDQAYLTEPCSMSLLYALEVPNEGGDTSWINMYEVLNRLPGSLKQRLEHRTVRNYGGLDSSGQLHAELPTDLTTYEGPSHPLIRKHPETNRNALYLGKRPCAYINGLPIEESEALLDALWDVSRHQDLVYCHQWKKRDLVVWDNRCTMHKREYFDREKVRRMRRTQCAGETPIQGSCDA